MQAKHLDSTHANKLKEKRNNAIREEFTQLTGPKHLATDYALEQLSKKYYLSTLTVWRIITGTGHYNKKTA